MAALWETDEHNQAPNIAYDLETAGWAALSNLVWARLRAWRLHCPSTGLQRRWRALELAYGEALVPQR